MADEDFGKKAFYANARTDGRGPLHGVRVLEVATTWAGPRCAQIFADYGADVIKIECGDAPDVTRRMPPVVPVNDPPEGYLHATVNRNKRSITLDLRKPAGRDVFHKLVATADLVVENMKAGTLASWGCGYADAKAVKDDIIYVSITGYGQWGPYSDRPGYDPMAQAMTGFMYMNGANEDAPPMKAPTFLSDELGGVHAAMSAMAALHHRNATGEGQHVDISLVDATICSSTGLHTIAAQGIPTPRLGNTYIFSAPANAYQCSDGWIYTGVLLDAHWKALAGLLGGDALSADGRFTQLPGRIEHRDELDRLMADWCRERTRGDVCAAVQGVGVPIAPVLAPAETVANEHVQARGAIQDADAGDGRVVKVPGPSAKFSRTPVRVRSAARPVGADTLEVLRELGMDDQSLTTLKGDGIL